MTSEEFCDDPYRTKALTELVVRIAQAEAPVSFDHVTAEVLEMLGIPKSTAKLKARCNYLIKASKLPVTVQKLNQDDSGDGTKFLWADMQATIGICPFYRIPKAGEKPRKACDIAVQEAARAAIDTAESQYGIPRESLITETAKALGFARTASNTECYRLCEQAVDYAFRKGALSVDNNGFITPSTTNI